MDGGTVRGTWEVLAAAWVRLPDKNIWQWAAEHVNFAAAQNYDTPRHDRFDPEWMPYWKEPAECLTDPSVREVVVLKCARAGGSENVLLNPIRYAVAAAPQPTLYVTGDQLSAERFNEKRVKRGFRASAVCWRAFKAATATQHDIAFPGMDFRVTWPKARQAFKQDGWALILCDEVSLWPEYSADMARKRADSYPFPHIVFLSSPDPAQKRSSEDDPIFVEYDRGDRRRWVCTSPKGEDFVFRFGGLDGDGVKWDQGAKREDGTWDIDRVKASAYYLTPMGERIEAKDRMAVVRSGRWVATNTAAPATVRSYHVNALMVPFTSGDFGEIAAAFLTAKWRGSQALRTFVYEYLAEPWAEKIEHTADEHLIACERSYQRGQKMGDALAEYKDRPSAIIIGADVQKTDIWWVAREWFDGGDSALLDYGRFTQFEELAQYADKIKCNRVLIDTRYRMLEVMEACYTFSFIPIQAMEKLDKPFRIKPTDPFEGTANAGSATLGLMQIFSDVFKSVLMSLQRGESDKKWMIPKGMPREYTRQVTAEQRTSGEWQRRKGYTANHLWDCETYSLAGAVYSKVYRSAFFVA